jgi:putative nucleotidyltransferase with HDIG domain
MKLKIQHRYIILVGVIVLLNFLFPPPTVPQRHKLEVGEIANFDAIAPYDFVIPKSEQELQQERDEIARRIPPVYVMNTTVPREVTKKSEGLWRLLDSLTAQQNALSRDSVVYRIQQEYAVDRGVIEYLMARNRARIFEGILTRMTDLYGTGIVREKPSSNRIITIVRDGRETVESGDRLYSLRDAEDIIAAGQSAEYRKLVQFLLIPNVTYDEVRTAEKIDAVFANVSKTKGTILKGEIIVEKHKRITEETIEVINALEATYVSIGAWEIVKTILFHNLLFFSIIFLLYKLGSIAHYNLLEDKHFLFITLLSVIYLIIGKIVYATDTIYLLPISFFIFLFTLYFDIYFGIVFTVIFAALFGVILDSTPIFTYLVVSGMVAAFSTQSISSRLSFYRPMLYIALANMCVILFADVYLLENPVSVIHLGEGILNSILASVFFVLLLPLLEKLFDFTTDLTLLELGNLNLPLFKEMAMEAPGSYHHSIIVGSLAEAGARAIGADPILARVGAYYHDIGKLKKPEYFIENQIAVENPHDTLKPQMSVLIIISHVKDGVEMAKKMKLPRSLVNVIEQHHGTTTIEPFYRKALSISGDITQDTFRYPGPRPKTKESAVVMLADSVEAAARSEKSATVNKLQRIVRDTIERKFNDGQLDESPITRHDLELIKTAFLSILPGVFHPRIEYEDIGKHAAPKNGRGDAKQL